MPVVLLSSRMAPMKQALFQKGRYLPQNSRFTPPLGAVQWLTLDSAGLAIY
jgi:hypothetical protein